LNSSSRNGPIGLPVKQTTQQVKPEADNALWRIKEWFPKMDPKLEESLHLYHSELIRFNGRLNLISRSTEREADENHFADSILAAELIAPLDLGKTCHDIGSGNGLPGLILAILRPDVKFFLVESDSRKSEFLKHMTFVLGLSNAEVLNVRLETLKASGVETGISRGFAALAKALLVVNRTFAKGGKFYHLKGNNWSREIADIPSQLMAVWTPELVGEYSLPVSQVRRAVVCTKKISN
jgi:16S rRNA (guanine527-N7)-methyltransferase